MKVNKAEMQKMHAKVKHLRDKLNELYFYMENAEDAGSDPEMFGDYINAKYRISDATDVLREALMNLEVR